MSNNKGVYIKCVQCGDEVPKGHSKHMPEGRICNDCLQENLREMNRRDLGYHSRMYDNLEQWQ